MKEHDNDSYLVRLLLYPLILVIIVSSAYGIFFMTNKEINWNSVDKGNSLYYTVLNFSNDFSSSVLIFSLIISNGIKGIFIGLLFVLSISLLRPFASSLRSDHGDIKSPEQSVTSSFYITLFISIALFIIIIIIAIIFRYFVTTFEIFIAVIILYIASMEMLLLLEKFIPRIRIKSSAKYLYRNIRRTLFYISIGITIAIYLELGAFTIFSYILGGINYSILQENMSFVLFGALNIILLIEIFEKYF